MVSFKMNLAFFVVVVACVASVNSTLNETFKYSEPIPDSPKNEINVTTESTLPTNSYKNLTSPIISTIPESNVTSTTKLPTSVSPSPKPTDPPTPKPTPPPTPTPPSTPKPTPPSTTPTPKPTIPPTPAPNTTTPTPSVSTTTETPSKAKSWDGTSFLSGMVLAFGIVAVGFVGYRFFYLGRGGTYHTL